MKKYIAFGVALVLLVLAFIVPNAFASGIDAGKGPDKNEKIEDFEDFSKLLVATEKLSQGKTKNFASVSFNLAYDSSRDYSYTATGVSNDTQTSTKSNSMVYLTKDAQYIKSSVCAYSQISSNDELGVATINFDIELYSSEKHQLVRFSKLEIITDGMATTEGDVGAYLNRWLDLDETALVLCAIPTVVVYGALTPVYALIDTLGSYTENHFEQSGDKFTVVERKLEELNEQFTPALPFAEDIEADSEVSFDLSNAKKPTLVAEFSFDFPEIFKAPSLVDESILNYKITSGSNFDKYQITFMNIDNTEIEFNLDDDDIYDDDELIQLQKDNGLWIDPDSIEDEEEEEVEE